MKKYNKLQYSGNINKWDEPTTKLGETTLSDAAAEELNKHFDSSGVKYVEVEESKQKAAKGQKVEPKESGDK